MPRSASTKNESDTETPEAPTNGEAESSAEEKPKRPYVRKPLPEGVSEDALGYGDLEPVDELPPKTKSHRGRGPDPRVQKIIDQLKATPGQWFKTGTFRSKITPDGLWKENGIEFDHRDYVNPENNEPVEGLYNRYARFPLKGDSGEG